jgi:hypothetical protein
MQEIYGNLYRRSGKKANELAGKGLSRPECSWQADAGTFPARIFPGTPNLRIEKTLEKVRFN